MSETADLRAVSTERQSGQILESRDQKIRSRRRSRGRLTDLFRTASCWRSARFSTARPARERSAVRTSTTNAFTNPISSLHSTAKRSFYPSTTSKRRCCKSMRCRHDEVFSRDRLADYLARCDRPCPALRSRRCRHRSNSPCCCLLQTTHGASPLRAEGGFSDASQRIATAINEST